jgi:hypothetical protein
MPFSAWATSSLVGNKTITERIFRGCQEMSQSQTEYE